MEFHIKVPEEVPFNHLFCNHFSRKVQKSGSRKVVLQTRFFFLVNHFSRTIKKVELYYKTTFFLVNHFSRTIKNVDIYYKTTLFSGQPLFSNHFSRTRFLEPDFSNHFSRTTFLHFSRKVAAEQMVEYMRLYMKKIWSKYIS